MDSYHSSYRILYLDNFTDVTPVEKNPLNIQKCLLPRCEFSLKNFGRYCLVENKIFAKIGLSDVNTVNNFCFLDTSVTICVGFPLEPITRAKYLREVKILDIPVIAKKIEILVSFNDILDLVEYTNNEKIEVIRNLLQFYTFKNKSCIFIENQIQGFGLHSIIINKVEATGKSEIFQVDLNTEIHIIKYVLKSEIETKKLEIDLRNFRPEHNEICTTLRKLLKLHEKRPNVKLPNKILLIGPKGSWKTILVHNIKSYFLNLCIIHISASYVNSLEPEDIQKYLKVNFQRAKAYSQTQRLCLVSVQNIDMMTSGKSVQYKKTVGLFMEFFNEIEKIKGIVVIATTSCPEGIDPLLRSSKGFEEYLEIDIPNENERRELIWSIFGCYIFNNDLESRTEYDYVINQIVKWTPGYVFSDLIMLFIEAILAAYSEENSLKSGFIKSEAFVRCVQIALTKVVPSGLRGALGLKTSNTAFSQIGGLENVKKILDLAVTKQLQHPEKFEKLGVPLTKGILLYGPPGCAKTTLVKALAKESNTTFLATSAADLYSPYVGDAEKKIVQLFSQARLGSPSIIFIDEIDAVVGSKSGDRERGVQERILSTLLVEMDGIGLKVNSSKDNPLSTLNDNENNSKNLKKKGLNNGVIVIGATNKPQFLDSALKRPGRFDRLLYVPPPDEGERCRILQKLTENMALDESVDFNHLAKATEYFSGADLKSLCTESGLHALYSTRMSATSISQSHFDHVLKDFRPSLNKDIINFYESFEKHNT